MQIIFLCLALIIYISLVFAVKFPIDSEGKSLTPIIRSGGFSLAATLVLLLISRLMIDWSAALEELFQILYGFLLLICLFWLFFSLFLTVKYGWICRKNSLYVSQAPGEHQGPLLTLGANHRKRPSTFQGHRPACPAGTPAGRLDRGGAVLERERELYLQRLSTAAASGKERSTPKREFFTLFLARRHHDEAPRSYRLGETN